MEKIQESWEKQKDIKNVMLFLQGYGVSTAYAAKIYRQYGKESIDTVKGNPYKLADDIWGIGFKTADGIANKMGYENNDPRRCKSGINYTLSELADEGLTAHSPQRSTDGWVIRICLFQSCVHTVM